MEVPDSLSPPIERRFLNENETEVKPLDIAGQQELVRYYRYAPILKYEEKHFRRNAAPDSDETRFVIIGVHICGGLTPGERVRFMLDEFVPALASDPSTRKLIPVRRHKVGRAPSGEPIFPGCMVFAHDFCEQFLPDESWMAPSEWASILKELAPVIALEKKITAQEAAFNAARNVEGAEAKLAQSNPTKFLAAGIAAGVGEALRQLNIAPRKGAA
jgi:hypothetical protein